MREVVKRLFAKEDPLLSRSALERAGFSIAPFDADPYRPLLHPDLPGHALLGVIGEARRLRDERWVARYSHQCKAISDADSTLLIAPKFLPIHLEKHERVVVLVEWPEFVSDEENLAHYRALDCNGVEELVRLVVKLCPFRLHPCRCRFTTGGRLFWHGRLGLTQILSHFQKGLVDHLDPMLAPFAREVAYKALQERVAKAAAGKEIEDPFSELGPYLLPADAPIKGVLDRLFTEPIDFIDPERIEQLGFTSGARWEKRVIPHFMVLAHPELPHHLIKTTPLVGDTADYSMRIRNLERRVRHARALKEYAEKNGFDRVVIPNKWLYRLPSSFNDPLAPCGKVCLVVDRVELQDRLACKQGYLNLDRETLRQLVELWVRVGNFEGFLQNLPLTVDGKIAIIDTERGGGSIESTPRTLLHHLSPEMAEYVLELSRRG